ncbi:MAG: insulinase family protein [Bacilli bacterium]|jgi:predicted Zn-dependent peptidase|nr:insulinase family protein [Bacilli bacterium]
MNNIIKNDKFKTNYLKIRYVIDCDELLYNKALLLSEYLTYANNKTKTDKKTIQLLDSLYDASFGVSVAIKSNKICFDFNIGFVASKYINDKNYLEKLMQTYYDFIFDPFTINNEFNIDIFEKNKFNIINALKAQYDDKNTYAYLQFNKIIGQDTSLAINSSGNENIINQLNINDIKVLYDDIIKTKPYFKGYVNNNDYEYINNFINNNFVLNNNYVYLTNTKLIKLTNDKVIEHDDITQGKLFIKIKFNNDFKKEDFIKYQLLNTILGSSSNSYLFKIVREEYNLCYSIRSLYNHYYNYIMITAGIDVNNYDKTISVIKDIIDKIKINDINQEDFDIAKISLIDIIKKLSDEQISMINYQINREALNVVSNIEDEISLINKLKKEDLKDVMSSIELEFKYMLGAINHE